MHGDELPKTKQYLGFHLTVQCDDEGDPFYHPQDVFPLDNPQGFCIGRAGGNDLHLTANGVSGSHSRIIADPSGVYLEDLKSRNGTYVNNNRLAEGERYLLRDGDIIRILNYNITFRTGLTAFAPDETEAVADIDNTFQLQQDLVQRFLDEPEHESPHIQIVAGPREGLSFELKEYEDFFIGRGRSCQLQLPDDAVSREHALLRRDWTGVTLRDLNSRNGIHINGTKLKRSTETPLSHGDQIVIGHHTLLFNDPFAASLSEKLGDVWEDEEVNDDIDGYTLPPQPAPGRKDKPADEPQSGQWRAPKRPKSKGPIDPSTPPSSPPPQLDTSPPASPPPQAEPEPASTEAPASSDPPPSRDSPALEAAPPRPVQLPSTSLTTGQRILLFFGFSFLLGLLVTVLVILFTS